MKEQVRNGLHVLKQNDARSPMMVSISTPDAVMIKALKRQAVSTLVKEEKGNTRFEADGGYPGTVVDTGTHKELLILFIQITLLKVVPDQLRNGP